MAPMFHLSVQYASRAVCPARAQVRRWVRATWSNVVDGEHGGSRGKSQRAESADSSARLVVRFVDAVEGRALNRDFRGKDYATNVLTFAYDDAGATVHADLIVCVPVVAIEAREQGKPLSAHFAHLVVHGVLHAAGYDHERARNAQRMETLEAVILARFRIANPYQP